MRSFTEIIDLWPTAEELGRDIDGNGLLVRAWKRRGSIPAEWWRSVEAAATSRGFTGVTVEVMADLAARRRSPEAAA